MSPYFTSCWVVIAKKAIRVYKKLDDSPPAIQTQKVTIILAISVQTSSDEAQSDSYNLDMFLTGLAV